VDLVTEEEDGGEECDKQNADRPPDNPGFPAHLLIIKKSIE
jgi:hypothetical protein